jgi:hypothetical protein
MSNGIQKVNTAVVPFDPTSISEAMQVAEMLARSGLVPDALRGKPSDILLVMMTGRDLGLSATQSFRAIHCIKGRPSLSAAYKVARAQQHPDCEYFRLVSSSGTEAVYETKRRGQPTPVKMSWTIAQAKQAGLSGDNWSKYPDAMLRARCGGALADAVYSDSIYGLPTAEEITDDPGVIQPLPTDIQAPAVPVMTGDAAIDAEFTVPEPAATEQTTEAQIAKAQGWIAQAGTRAELNDVAGLIKDLPGDVKAAVRGSFAARTAELKA